MKQQLINTYLEYLNNYLTVPKMAEDYGIEYNDMKALISMGRSYFESTIKRIV